MDLQPTGYLQVSAEGRLQLRRCRRTGEVVEYGSSYCRCCDGNTFAFADAGNEAELTAIAWYHRQYSSEQPVPYNVAVARLASGPEVVGTVLNVDPAEHPVGRSVQVEMAADGRLSFTLAEFGVSSPQSTS